MSDLRRVAASIVAFLRSPEARAGLEADAAEGLTVAAQCLEESYSLVSNPLPPEAFPVPDLLVALVPQLHFRVIASSVNLPEGSVPPSAEAKAKADALKNEGNALMKAEKHQEALDKYTEAISLDPTNAIYYCNRAAARSSLKADEAAIDDCKRALALNPKYGRAYGRLGLALTNLGRHREARDAYGVACGLEPENEAYRNNLAVTEETLRRSTESQPRPPPVATPAGLDLNSLLQNQALASVATQMLSDPGLQNLMGRLIGDLSGAEPQRADEGQQPAGGGLDALLQAGQRLAHQMQQANPEFVEQLRQQMANSQQPPQNPQNPPKPKPPQ